MCVDMKVCFFYYTITYDIYEVFICLFMDTITVGL